MKISDRIAQGMLNLHIWKSFVCSKFLLACKRYVSKSAIRATEFTAEDQYLSKCLLINKKYGANRFLKICRHKKEV